MNDYKFDTFYYTVDRSSEHYLSEIENLSAEDYRASFKGKMYCPWCKGPQLNLIHSEYGKYLRTFPKQKHIVINEEFCPYGFETASNKQVEKFIQKLKKRKKIKSLLESIMRQLFDLDTPKQINEKNTSDFVSNPLLIEENNSSKTGVKKIIPHYNFKTWGKNIPPEQLLIVYGKVFITLRDFPIKTGEMQTFIRFCDISTQSFITSCIKPRGLEISEGYYYAVALGKCQRRETDKCIFYNLRLNSPIEDSILLKTLNIN